MFFDIDQQTVKDVEALRAFKLTRKAKDAAPIDDFEVIYKDVIHEEMTDAEIRAFDGKVFEYDVECFANYFLVAFRSIDTGKVITFEQYISPDSVGCGGCVGLCDGMCSSQCSCLVVGFNAHKLAYVINHMCIVGFNSRNYDLPMVMLALRGATNEELCQASFQLIVGNMWPSTFEKEYDLKIPYLKHIDLIEVAPLSASLKTYAGRLNCKRMQDLPANPEESLTPEKMRQVKLYCLNDLANTELLTNELSPALTLRKDIGDQYGVNVLSKSDAQVAETIIGKELQRITGEWPKKSDIEAGKVHFYRVPQFLQYANPVLQNVLEVVRSTPFVVQSNGYITMPEAIGNLEINIGRCQYRMGIGGLHSSEKTIVHKATDKIMLLDRDVASYYPMIILNQGLFPKHIGKHFLAVYKGIVERRLKAKDAGDEKTAASLKIAINGIFGKLGNPYSFLYSPELMLQITVSGQLCLLLLIDMMEHYGFSVISANTDGIIVECPVERHADYLQVVAMWEQITGFKTEETQYKAIYSRDVNNYLGITTKGKVKQKGAYAYVGSAGNSPLSRNPENFICLDAVISYLTDNKPIQETIHGCRDIRRFCTVRNVRGGAVKSGNYLGKCIRWYISTEMKGEINYLSSGNKVPNSDGARPLMELPDEMPSDIDYTRYESIATEMLQDLGVLAKPCSTKKQRKQTTFDFD